MTQINILPKSRSLSQLRRKASLCEPSGFSFVKILKILPHSYSKTKIILHFRRMIFYIPNPPSFHHQRE